ncbi:p450 domain-containing protein [Cephalotus follicularis]|uniref:p450 domain-containing protein n=1 Tax=Cephalotus follicularis TaxID=3775 RepID=A0A1Q3CDL0_CEPFO|nr:p450 domain-containing protein [Cephalotus follicularis]
MEFLIQLLLVASLFSLVVLYNKLWKTRSISKRIKGTEAPEPRHAWPFIGHLHLLRGQKPVCQILAAMADTHGPVFTIRVGMKRALVVSSWEAVKDCYRDNDTIFLTRPPLAAMKYMGYNGAMPGLGPSGPFWQAMRKIMTLNILSSRQLELLKHVRASEVDIGIKDLYSMCTTIGKSCSAMVDLGQWFSFVTLNTIIKMIAGKRFSSSGNDKEFQRFGRAITDFMRLTGALVISDVIPYTEWLDLQGHLRSMERTAKEMDYFLSSWLEEHLQERRDSKVKADRDFIDVMLSLFENEDSMYGHKVEDIIKGTSSGLILGSSDTTPTTLIWTVSLLLNNPETLKHAQDEIDIHVGRERWVEEYDFKKLGYLRAIVKETLRLYPGGPLSAPREAMEDCYVAGYHVPKGTRLITNIWKLHRDPRVWPNPSEFQPERFLTTHANFDVGGQHFGYIPFSSGRRSCPGILSAMQMSQLMLARLLQGFEIATLMNAPVDMSEGSGLSLPKAKPLEVILTPRLPEELYET